MILDFEHSPRVMTTSLVGLMENRGLSIYSLHPAAGRLLTAAQNLPGCCIAGGAPLALFTGELGTIKDWDLFFTSEEALDAAIKSLEDSGFVPALNHFETTLALTYVKKPVIVQAVKRRFYDTIDQIFEDFDFTVCCVAVCGNDICYTRLAERHIASRTYDLVRPHSFSMCIKRIARYAQKGYLPSERFPQNLAMAMKNGLPLRKDFY